MTTVVTGWKGGSYQQLGEEFIRTFDNYWPTEIELAAVVDIPANFHGRYLDRLTTFRASDCDGLDDFISRHSGNRLYTGKAEQRSWTPSERHNGYSYRHDAVKFAPQLFFPELVSQDLNDGEILAWFDADVVTFRQVPERFIDGLIGESELVYLGRPPRHSEIGFWAVRLNNRTRRFLTALADMYRNDSLFKLSEWHSAFVFDHVRTAYEMDGMQSRNLTGDAQGHVWFKCELGTMTDHLKGKRKIIGRSAERK